MIKYNIFPFLQLFVNSAHRLQRKKMTILSHMWSRRLGEIMRFTPKEWWVVKEQILHMCQHEIIREDFWKVFIISTHGLQGGKAIFSLMSSKGLHGIIGVSIFGIQSGGNDNLFPYIVGKNLWNYARIKLKDCKYRKKKKKKILHVSSGRIYEIIHDSLSSILRIRKEQ